MNITTYGGMHSITTIHIKLGTGLHLHTLLPNPVLINIFIKGFFISFLEIGLENNVVLEVLTMASPPPLSSEALRDFLHGWLL